jgi:chitodextrinase
MRWSLARAGARDMRTFNARLIIVVFLSVSLFAFTVGATSLWAQSAQGLASMQFGHGKPKQISDLPPGQLKRKLESLPPQASAKALKWLQSIEFTGTDLGVLKVDGAGGVYFEDTLLPDPTLAQQAPTATLPDEAPGTTLADAFTLHSRPGAPNKVFIDFDGHVITATAWGAGSFTAVPFDLDGNNATFNDTERERIVDIWHRVAEDLTPFNIDVTTEEPASFDRYTGRILVTRDIDANGVNMPSKGAGGVAYVGVFGASNYHSYYSPALVYYNNLGGGVETYVAEASAHEFGHNLGLSHDGTTTGTTYYAGHGSGLVSWAPIMGNSYYNNVTQWSKGGYPNANQTQDDVAIIQSVLGLSPDAQGNTVSSSAALVVDANGSVVSSNPELDPHNVLTQNKGAINSASDVDVFTFSAGAGALSLTVRPAWDAFYRDTTRRGANLDIKVELRNAAGSLVTSDDPSGDTAAAVSVTVSAGSYHLLISGQGVGLTSTGYTDYASVGQYFINGSMAVGTGDHIPPNPDPMNWSSQPAAISSSAIAMTASIATDESSTVQYNFQCLAGGAGCVSSGWKSSNSHTISGLAANTAYTFNVTARDQAGNMTNASPNVTASTMAAPPPPPAGQVVASSDTVIAGVVSGTYSATQSDDAAFQSIREVESGGKKGKRYSYLEHRWNFSLSSSQNVVVTTNAWSSGSGDGDQFKFEYSVNGGRSWGALFTINSTSNSNVQTFAIPGAQSGSLIVRVVDTNRVAGKLEMNTVYVDRLCLEF